LLVVYAAYVHTVRERDWSLQRDGAAIPRPAARRTPAAVIRHPCRLRSGISARRVAHAAGGTASVRRRLRSVGDLMSEEIVSELMRAHVYRLASTGQRLDGRALDEPRKVSLERAFVKTAEGSARVTLGHTDGLGGI